MIIKLMTVKIKFNNILIKHSNRLIWTNKVLYRRIDW